MVKRIGELDPRIVPLDDVTTARADQENVDLWPLESRVDIINRLLATAMDQETTELAMELLDSTVAPSGYYFAHVYLCAFEDKKRADSRANLTLNGPARNISAKVEKTYRENGVCVTRFKEVPAVSARSRKAKCNKTFGRLPNRRQCTNEASFLKVTGKTSRQYRCKECLPPDTTGFQSIKVGLNVPPPTQDNNQ